MLPKHAHISGYAVQPPQPVGQPPGHAGAHRTAPPQPRRPQPDTECITLVNMPRMRDVQQQGWAHLIASTTEPDDADGRPGHMTHGSGAASHGAASGQHGAPGRPGSAADGSAAQHALLHALAHEGGDVGGCAHALLEGLAAGCGGMLLGRLSALRGYHEVFTLLAAVRQVGAHV